MTSVSLNPKPSRGHYKKRPVHQHMAAAHQHMVAAPNQHMAAAHQHMAAAPNQHLAAANPTTHSQTLMTLEELSPSSSSSV